MQAVVEGSYGRFDFDRKMDKQIWIAGGIGITLFLSQIRTLRAEMKDSNYQKPTKK